MTRPHGALRVDEPHKIKKRKWPWVLLAILVLLIALLVAFFALGWLSIDFTGGNVDVDAPDVDVDTNVPDVDVDPGELPDIDVEQSPSN